jgi:hypothetical protein
MAIINKINANGTDYDIKGSLLYGVCDSAEDAVAKAVTVDGNFSLYTGATVMIKFTNANTVASPTLNVNGTGAKPIIVYGTTAASTSTTVTGWVADSVNLFVYDGTNWLRLYWRNTTYSNPALGHGYGECTTAAATTAKTATISSYSLTTGGSVSIKFKYAVPANATLNIRSCGAKAIYYNGAAITAGIIEAGDIVTMVYDGSYYQVISIEKGAATTSTAGWMSAADKTKLDGIATGADAVEFTSNLTSGTKIGTIKINSTSTDIYAPAATEAADSTYIGTTDPGINSGIKIWIDPSEMNVALIDGVEF